MRWHGCGGMGAVSRWDCGAEVPMVWGLSHSEKGSRGPSPGPCLAPALRRPNFKLDFHNFFKKSKSQMTKRNCPSKLTPARQAVYLKALEGCGEVTASAATAGITRRTVYARMDADPDFKDACDKAKGALIGRLMATCETLALEGVLHETFDPKTGNVIRRKRVFDARIVLAWLKRLEREKWGDQVKVNKQVQVTHTARIEVENMTPESRTAARKFLATLPRITVDDA